MKITGLKAITYLFICTLIILFLAIIISRILKLRKLKSNMEEIIKLEKIQFIEYKYNDKQISVFDFIGDYSNFILNNIHKQTTQLRRLLVDYTDAVLTLKKVPSLTQEGKSKLENIKYKLRSKYFANVFVLNIYAALFDGLQKLNGFYELCHTSLKMAIDLTSFSDETSLNDTAVKFILKGLFFQQFEFIGDQTKKIYTSITCEDLKTLIKLIRKNTIWNI